MLSKKRNGEIEILRLFFTCAVLLVHSQFASHGDSYPLFHGGWLGVEFFFLVSGYLMCSYEDHLPPPREHSADGTGIGSDTLRFILKKAKSLFPYLTFALLTQFLGWRTFINGIFFPPLSGSDLKSLVTIPLNFIFPYSLCYDGYFYLTYSWYLSAMIWGMFLLFPMLRRNRNMFYCVVAPIITAFGLGFYSWRYSSLAIAQLNDYLLSAGLIRGMAEMSLGCLCYAACKKLRAVHLTKGGVCLLSGIEFFSILGVVVRVIFGKEDGIMDFTILPLLAVAVTIAFSGRSFTAFEISGKWANRLGKFSLALYLNSGCWSFMTARAWPEMNYWKATAIYLCLTLISALLCMAVCGGLQTLWRKRWKDKVYRLLFVTDPSTE